MDKCWTNFGTLDQNMSDLQNTDLNSLKWCKKSKMYPNIRKLFMILSQTFHTGIRYLLLKTFQDLSKQMNGLLNGFTGSQPFQIESDNNMLMMICSAALDFQTQSVSLKPSLIYLPSRHCIAHSSSVSTEMQKEGGFIFHSYCA